MLHMADEVAVTIHIPVNCELISFVKRHEVSAMI